MEMWLDLEKPLMRSATATDEDVVLSRFTGHLYEGILEMIPDPMFAI